MNMSTGPLKEGSKEWWVQRYENSSEYMYGKAPSVFLSEYIDLLTKGLALDVGMGEGRNSVFLASRGFSVTGVDFLGVAVERAKKFAQESGVKIETKLQDLDFFLIPLMSYDTILVCDYHPPLTVLKSLSRGLKPGGTLLLEGYALEQLRLEKGYKPDPTECFKPNEVLEHVRDLHVILYNERRLSSAEARVQLIARKPLR